MNSNSHNQNQFYTVLRVVNVTISRFEIKWRSCKTLEDFLPWEETRDDDSLKLIPHFQRIKQHVLC